MSRVSTETNAVATCLVYNVTLIGMYGVGKSSIINKLRQNRFVKSYKPSDSAKIFKHPVSQAVQGLEDTEVKLSLRDSMGLSCPHSNDAVFMSRRAHMLCFVYDYDNADSYDCVKYLLENTNDLFTANRVVMVLRNKVDSKEIIAESESLCEQQFREITAIHEEIMFVKNFSAKSKSQDKIEKVFIKGVELYRQYYGDMPAAGGSKRKDTLKSDAYVGTPKSGDSKPNNLKKDGDKNTKKHGKKQSAGRTPNATTDEASKDGDSVDSAQCACVIL